MSVTHIKFDPTETRLSDWFQLVGRDPITKREVHHYEFPNELAALREFNRHVGCDSDFEWAINRMVRSQITGWHRRG